MTDQEIDAAVEAGFAIGMHQHPEEIRWLAGEVAAINPERVLEIGTLHGGTAVLWKELGAALVVTIDLPTGNFGGAAHGYGDMQKRLDRYALLHERGILSYDEDSHEIRAQEIARTHGPFDVLFIDGDHTLPGVAADYEIYKRFVRPGGLIAFHDINMTGFHHEAGCWVDALWAHLRDVQKLETREYSIHANWGGVGIVVNR